MVLGKHRFTWRDDVRGALTVLGLGVVALVVLTLVIVAVLLATAAWAQSPR